jgi:hypothetical protein
LGSQSPAEHLILTLPVPGLLSIGFAASTNLILWHSLLLCLQISKLNPQFSFVHNEFLAVGAVISELVSVSPFPCFAGIYREICRIQRKDDD